MVGAIIRRCDSVFAARRNADRSAGGLWEFPGGKVEPGESWEEALHREIAEELGVRIRLGAVALGPLPDGRWQLSSRHVIAVWLAQVDHGRPEPLDEHDAVRWLGPADLGGAGDLAWAPADLPLLAPLAAHLRAAGD